MRSKPSSATSVRPASTATPMPRRAIRSTAYSSRGRKGRWRETKEKARSWRNGPLAAQCCQCLVSHVEIHAVERIARLLRPDAVLLHRDLMHLDLGDLELAGFVINPEIDVVILVLAAGFAEVGAGEILAVLLQMTHRLVHLDELERNGLAGLVVLDHEIAVRVLVGGDVVVNRAHHVPGASHLHV